MCSAGGARATYVPESPDRNGVAPAEAPADHASYAPRMRTLRLPLTLALVSAMSSACWAAHERDAGVDPVDGESPRPDVGPGCRALDGVVESITCELAPSGEGLVHVRTMPTLCCGSGTPTVTARGTTLEVSWIACDCCEGCRCIGPIQDVTVSLGVLGPGTHVVTAGGATCTLEGVTPPMCRPGDAEEVRHAQVLYPDQPVAATVVSDRGTGCDCDPRVVGPDDWRLELCGCCDECDCIDGGYEASFVGPPLALGEHSIVIPHGVATISVHAREDCRPLEARGLRIVVPSPSRVIGGPRLVWAVVSGAEALCCATPAPAVDSTGIGPMGEIVLSLASCVTADCFCEPPGEIPFEAWHSLGELSPGTHTVVVTSTTGPALVQSFTL